MLRFQPAGVPIQIAGKPQEPHHLGTAARWAPEMHTLAQPEGNDPARVEIEQSIVELSVAVRTMAASLLDDVRLSTGDLGWPREGRPSWADLPPDVMRGQIIQVAEKLEVFIAESLSPPLSPYVDAGAEGNFMEASGSIREAIGQATTFGSRELPAGMEGLADDYAVARLDDLKELRDAIQRAIVAHENGDVPVREASEEEAAQATGVLIAIGILAVSGVVLWATSGP